jgi:hypothetical protein
MGAALQSHVAGALMLGPMIEDGRLTGNGQVPLQRLRFLKRF